MAAVETQCSKTSVYGSEIIVDQIYLVTDLNLCPGRIMTSFNNFVFIKIIPAGFKNSLGFKGYSFLLQDVDLLKFQITCFTTYYPAMLGKKKYVPK